MASFSDTSFDAKGYSSNRPSYPPALYSYIDDCTRSRGPTRQSTSPTVCIDLGCGPGLSTFGFATKFDQVIGVEPGSGMVQVANGLRDLQPETIKSRIRFEQGTAEDLTSIVPENESVDLVVACTSAHWFKDQAAVYREIARVLKPSGSFFFFTYSSLHFPNDPEFESLLPEFNDQTLGPYWSEPGHHLSETLLAAYPLPYLSNFPPSDQSSSSSSFTSAFDEKTFARSFFLIPSEEQEEEGDETTSSTRLKMKTKTTIGSIPRNEIEIEHVRIEKVDIVDDRDDRMLKRVWGLDEVKNLLNTWSAAHDWNEDHPGRDCAREFVDKLRRAGWNDGERRLVMWEIGALYGRKR